MQSQAVKEEARFVEDGIKNGNIAASGVNTVPTIAKEEQIIAQPAFLALMNMVESKPPPTARAGRSQSWILRKIGKPCALLHFYSLVKRIWKHCRINRRGDYVTFNAKVNPNSGCNKEHRIKQSGYL